MIKIWIIDDDEHNRRVYSNLFKQSDLDVKVKTFECLFDASECVSDVDYIFIDLSAVDARTIPCFDNHSYIGCLQQFVEKHTFSFIVIMSALIDHAKEDVEDLRKACPDVLLFSLDPCGRKNHNALVDFIKKYSSDKGDLNNG